MSGTPVLSTLVDGLAGSTPISLRGILNATANFILTRMERGASYEDTLTEAQHLGLAERDPHCRRRRLRRHGKGDDSRGTRVRDAAASRGRRPSWNLENRSNSNRAATAEGARIKQLVTLELSAAGGAASFSARVEPALLPNEDRLAGVSGVANVVVCRAEPVGGVIVTGPGAGPELAG